MLPPGSKVVVTGSAGHLGEAILRTLRADGVDAVGVDILESAFTDQVGSIADRAFVRRATSGATHIVHTATLHKPHCATHTRQDFVNTNITGTLNLLEEAAEGAVESFVFTSTTSAFGHALVNADGAGPATWITEEVVPVPKNIYGATKTAAEDLCHLVHQDTGLPVLVLRTSRFFGELDDNPATRATHCDPNIKANEFLSRRVDIADVVSAHLLALERAPTLKFDRFIISATTPFTRNDTLELRHDAPSVLQRCVPAYTTEYARRGWSMFPSLDRVYDNTKARTRLGWTPLYDFEYVLQLLAADREPRSQLACDVGVKPYHTSGRYPFVD